MNNLETLKHVLIPELYEWAETFIGEVDEEGELTMEPYDTVYSLAERFEAGTCSEADYRDILFHIWQINYDEERIRLEGIDDEWE